jgi:hypothetical protein
MYRNEKEGVDDSKVGEEGESELVANQDTGLLNRWFADDIHSILLLSCAGIHKKIRKQKSVRRRLNCECMTAQILLL